MNKKNNNMKSNLLEMKKYHQSDLLLNGNN